MKNRSDIFRLSVPIALAGVTAIFLGKLIAESTHAALLSVGFFLGFIVVILTMIRPFLGLYVLVYSMLLSPEVPLAQVPSRALILRIDDLLIILIFFTWLARSAIRKEMTFRNTPLNVPMGTYVFLVLLATGLGLLRGEGSWLVASLFSLKYIEYLMIFILTVNLVDTRERALGLLKAFFVTGACVLIFAYAVTLFQNQAPYAPFDVEEGVQEPASLAGYLMLLLGISWGMFSSGIWGSWTPLMLVFWFASVPILLLTQSRASYFSFAGMLVCTLLWEKKKRFLLMGLLSAGGLGITFFAPQTFEMVRKRLLYTFENQGGPQMQMGGKSFYLEQSAQGRVVFWKRAFQLYLPQNPILGHGVGHRPALEGQIPVVVYETGLLGLLFFLWLLARLWGTGWRTFRTSLDPLAQGVAMGFMIGFVGIFLQSLFNTTFIIIRVMEPFWFLAGLLVVSKKIENA